MQSKSYPDLVGLPSNFIEFTIINAEEEHRLKVQWDEYPDLRELINDKFHLQAFGECGGMGRCATCMVRIRKLADQPGADKSEISLSCQVLITDQLSNSYILIDR